MDVIENPVISAAKDMRSELIERLQFSVELRSVTHDAWEDLRKVDRLFGKRNANPKLFQEDLDSGDVELIQRQLDKMSALEALLRETDPNFSEEDLFTEA